MQVAVRPYVTTGIALVGASVIAVTPIAVAPPDVKVPAVSTSTTAVALTAATNPIAAWVDLVSSALGNGTAIAQDWLSDPAPILRQIIENQIGYLGTAVEAGQGVLEGFVSYLNPSNEFGFFGTMQTAFEELASGNIAGAIETTSQALILLPLLNIGAPLLTSGLLQIPATITQNIANVVTLLTSPETALPVLLGGLGSLLAPINAFGDQVQGVFDSLADGDPISAVGAILSAPAVIIGALVNGYTNAEGTEFPGLFTFGDNPFNAGLIQALFVNLPRAIAEAIAPPAPFATTEATDEVASTTRTAALTVTMDVAPSDTGELTASVSTATDPESEPVAATESDDEEASGASDATTETEEGAEAESGTEDGAGSDGSTDLSDGNKVEPGDTVTGGTGAGDDGTAGADEDADTETAAGDTETDTGAADGADGGDANSGGDE